MPIELINNLVKAKETMNLHRTEAEIFVYLLGNLIDNITSVKSVQKGKLTSVS